MSPIEVPDKASTAKISHSSVLIWCFQNLKFDLSQDGPLSIWILTMEYVP